MLINEHNERAKDSSRKEKARKMAIGFCLSVSFASVGAVNGAIAPFYPKEALAKGAGPQISGMIFASYTLATILMGPLTSFLPARVTLKFLLVSGLFIEGSTQILFGFLSEMPAGTCFTAFSFIIRILGGAGASPFFTAGSAIGMNTFPDKLTLIMGILESSYGIGLCLGPPLGGLLYAAGGFRLPFLVMGTTTLAFCLPFMFLLPKENDISDLQASQNAGKKIGMLSLLKVPESLLMAVMLFGSVVFMSCLRPILVFHLDKYSLTESQIGLVFFVPPAFYTALSVIYGYFVTDKHIRTFISIGFFLIAVGFILIGPSPLFQNALPSLLGVDCFALALNGIGITPTSVSALPEMTKALRAKKLGNNEESASAASAFWLTVLSIGSLVGPSLSGWLYKYVGFAWVTTIFGFWAILQIIIMVIFVSLMRRKQRVIKEDGEEKSLITSECF